MFTMMAYSAWSSAYSTDPVEQTRIYLSVNEWNRIHDEHSSAKRVFGRIMIGDKDVFCPLGEPTSTGHFETGTKKPVIIPNWALEILGVEGSGEDIEITWLAEDSFPNASKVVLRSHDSALYHADIKEELERELTMYGVIVQGTTIPVTISSLGGFSLQIDIVHTYPANIVLLDGDEITFEFETALDAPEEVVTEPVPAFPSYEPIPVATPVAEFPLPESFALPIPVATVVPEGIRLGGRVPPPLPDGRLWNPWREV